MMLPNAGSSDSEWPQKDETCPTHSPKEARKILDLVDFKKKRNLSEGRELG